MNYAIFSYKEDWKCLELCVAQIRRADDEARIYIFDDGKASLLQENVPAGDDVIYRRTWFERRGNLNGLECVRGILAAMLDIPGDEPVIKIDADTLLWNAAPIRESLEKGALAGGMQARLPLAWSGICYWLTKRAIQNALELLLRREWPEHAENRYPEDVTICRIMCYLYGRSGVDLFEFKGGAYVMGVLTCDPAELLNMAQIIRVKKPVAVHCGQMMEYLPIVEQFGCSIREACARIMFEMLHPGADGRGFSLCPAGKD